MGLITDEQFLALFRQMHEPVAGVEGRLADLEKHPSRAEVAGAVEVVATLPAAGQQGRLLYQSGDPAGLYVDGGSQWAGPVASPEPGGLLAFNSVVVSATVAHNTADFQPVEPSTWYLDVVAPPGPFEVVAACMARRNSGATANGRLDIGYDAGGGTYVRAGDVDNGLALTSPEAVSYFEITSHWTGLTPGQTYRFYLMSKSAGTNGNLFPLGQLVRFWAKGL